MSDAMEIKTLASTHTLLDRFYISRVRIHVLIRQYLSLGQPPVKYYVGIVCSWAILWDILKRVIHNTLFMCTTEYRNAPEVIIAGCLDM